MADLVEGFRLIRQGGTLVVHDCLPPRSENAVPNYIQGEWCGVSYQAYVDFISERHDLAVYTVDTDYGCGVIRKLADPTPESATLPALSFSKTGAASATTPRKPSPSFRRTSRFC
jgi:hypothetical protein